MTPTFKRAQWFCGTVSQTFVIFTKHPLELDSEASSNMHSSFIQCSNVSVMTEDGQSLEGSVLMSEEREVNPEVRVEWYEVFGRVDISLKCVDCRVKLSFSTVG